MEEYKTEEQLGDAVVALLENLSYEVWCEVESMAGIIDIVAMKNNTYYTYHLKKQLSNKVLEQAGRCHFYNTYDYVVVPYRKKYKIDEVKSLYIEKYNIGVLSLYNNLSDTMGRPETTRVDRFAEYYFFSTLRYIEQSEIKKYEQNISEILFDSQKTAKAGIKGGGYDTAFKRSLRKIKEYHIENEYISLNNTWDNLEKELHWSSKYSFFSAMSSLSHLDIVKEARNVMMDKR
jgi:hypothetical protein